MYQPRMEENIRRSIRRRIDGLTRALHLGLDSEELQQMKNQVHLIQGHIQSLESRMSEENWQVLVNVCNELRQNIDIHIDGNVADDSSDLQENVAPTHSSTGRQGRPKMLIEKPKLQELLDYGFTVSKIASQSLLGFPVHRNTIHKFMKDEGDF